MKFRRFTKPHFLKGIGRELLGKLFGRFAGDLAARKVALPVGDLADDAYFSALSGVAMSPDGLPDSLIETLFAIEEMANEEEQDRLQAGAAQAGLALIFDEHSSHGDVAVQVFLAKPELLAEKHNEQRLIRLATFDYYGSKKNRHLIRPAVTLTHSLPLARPDGPSTGRIPSTASQAMEVSPSEAEKGCEATKVNGDTAFVAPSQAILDLLAGDLDAWFKEHNRGEQTTHIEAYVMDGEFWFLVRHGDTFARTAKVEKRKTEVIHFRPAKDDVVVYSPQRDEIRIHAGTKGEKELYRKSFGTRLRGDDNYFSAHKTYTLEPLRALGTDALDVTGIAGVTRVVLRELEVAYDNGHDEIAIRKADDLFAAAADAPFERQAVPAKGRLVRANFEFYFDGCEKPRHVQLRPHNTLKLGRHCDAAVVQRWLSERGFRAVIVAEDNQRENFRRDAATGRRDARAPLSGEGNNSHVERLALS